MSTATTGTGTITLGSAVSGYLTFALAGVADGGVVSYGIKDGANSEVGTGTYTSAGTTLTRTPTSSTNSNNAIDLSGSAEVFITPRKEDLLSITETQTANTVFSGPTSGGAATPSFRALVSADLPAASAAAAGAIEIADQSEMETGTDNTRAVAPGVQHYHPSAAKCWCKWVSNSTTIRASYNITSITDGAAQSTVNVATDFSSAHWAASVAIRPEAVSDEIVFISGQTAGTLIVKVYAIAAAAVADPSALSEFYMTGFGDQA